MICIGAGLTADLWSANPYLASLGLPLIVWGIAEVMEARSKILRFFQEARKQGLLVKGRTFFTSQIQTLGPVQRTRLLLKKVILGKRDKQFV